MTDAEPFLTLQDEFERWKRREKSLTEELRTVKEEERTLVAELAKVEEQVSYYDSLEKGMKKELDPPQLRELLRSLSKR